MLEMAWLTFLGDRGEHDFDGKFFRRDNRHDVTVSGLYVRFLKEPNHNKTQSW